MSKLLTASLNAFVQIELLVDSHSRKINYRREDQQSCQSFVRTSYLDDLIKRNSCLHPVHLRHAQCVTRGLTSVRPLSHGDSHNRAIAHQGGQVSVRAPFETLVARLDDGKRKLKLTQRKVHANTRRDARKEGKGRASTKTGLQAPVKTMSGIILYLGTKKPKTNPHTPRLSTSKRCRLHHSDLLQSE